MKKVLFASYSLELGGIEKALVNLLNKIDYSNYDITLYLQKMDNLFYNVPNKVIIKKYEISENKNVILRKIFNRFKIIVNILKNYHKYHASICYATYDIPSSIITRYASRNNILWVHSDYYYLYNKDINKVKEFFNKRKVNKFKKIVFVSNEARDHFLKIYPNMKNRVIVINNLVNTEEIKRNSLDNINIIKKNKTLVFVGRLDEESKKISRLINVMKKLKEDKILVDLWIIGDGIDRLRYEDLIKKNKLEDNIKVLGSKINPYPYIKQADALILVSLYEGFPVVYLEALTLNKPIITTIDVTSGSLSISSYAYMCKQEEDDIYNKIKLYLNSKNINNDFNIEKYNIENLNKIYKIIGDNND